MTKGSSQKFPVQGFDIFIFMRLTQNFSFVFSVNGFKPLCALSDHLPDVAALRRLCNLRDNPLLL